MTANLGTIDRILRLAIGILLVLAPFVGQISLLQSGGATALSVIVGLVLIATSALKFCPLYRIFGIRTCKS